MNSTPDKPEAGDFVRAEPQLDLPGLDRRILEYWDNTDAFQQSVDLRPADAEYTFYDGPPFATGSRRQQDWWRATRDCIPRSGRR